MISQIVSGQPLPRNVLLCEEALAWLGRCPSRSIDAVITDPPYGLGQCYAGVQEEHSSPKTYGPWIRRVYEECRRVVKPEGTIIFRQARIYWRFLATWFPLADQLILAKNQVDDQGYDLTHAYDPLILWQDWRLRPKRPAMRGYRAARATDIISGDTSRSVRETLLGQHPFPFPRDAAERLILQFTEPGDLVLDPFMGSGVIPVAAWWWGRDYLGLDREPTYHQLAHAVLRYAVQDTARPGPMTWARKLELDRLEDTEQEQQRYEVHPRPDRGDRPASGRLRRPRVPTRRSQRHPLAQERSPSRLLQGQSPGRPPARASQSPSLKRIWIRFAAHPAPAG